MSHKPLVPTLVAIVSSIVLVATVAASQRKPPQLIIDSMAGKDLFQFYCSSCHGRDGKGGGPVGSALKTAPADLTTIAARNDGRFPRVRIIAFISTDEPAVAAHGSAEMPVWGPIFQGLDASPTRARIRIENLVSYLESIQQK